MKRRIIIALMLIVAAAFIGRQMTCTDRHANDGPKTERGNGRDETHETYKLEPGATIDVRGINGSVEVTTSETETADVRIVRTAGSQDDLDRQKVVIEHTPSSLVVRTENASRGWFNWFGGNPVRQQVVLAVPRRIELSTKGVNGPVNIGDIEGGVEVSGINGRVEVGQVAGYSRFSGINGNVKAVVKANDGEGMNVKGINGGVEIRLPVGIDADISVKGLNGSVALNVPNVTMQEKEGRSKMRARIGAGGMLIEVKGVNGSVRFEPNAAPAAQ